jgi:gliding motility-associated-like protein
MLEGKSSELKYSLHVSAGIDPAIIQMNYEGHKSISIDENGNLKILHDFGTINESKPIAWQIIGDRKKKIPVEFALNNNVVSFNFPQGFDPSYEIVIDPSLTFSSFSGSTADNWGFTAAPDEFGRLFGGGIVFGLGYPIMVGSYDTTFNGGQIDVAVSKFSEDGTYLIYSTYIGGNGSETPHSIVSAPNGELFIFGVTSSANFPMAGSSYDPSYAGGPNLGAVNGLDFSGGSDLYVARLDPLGTNLIASTYVGGTNNDGLNMSNIAFNYGDEYRGEIILDDNGDVYVASNTTSADFPTLQGAQGALNGPQDAVIFKMTPGLDAMIWSTYFGGSAEDVANSVQIAANGDVYIAGGTKSTNMPFTFGNDLTFGGTTDGFLARFNGNTGAQLSGTYIGLGEYDQAHFVQLDPDDNVYVYGQSESDLGVVGATYGIPNSGQFIWKYDHNLTSIFWKTMIGAGSGHVELSPTAFLVSDCYDIYIAGWGGSLNVQYSQAVNSTTNGFPVTTGPNNTAYQTATDGSNFYLAVLAQDASALKYATFMGGINLGSPNHVDGGTSRFDKSGRVYHSVCGACGGNPGGFTSTPGAWSSTNQSSNCNMACFKFELSTIEALVTDPDPIICLPDPVIFQNNSSNGNEFFWDFGDNTTSTDVNPVHLYPGPGQYTVTLVVSDSNGCFAPDSIQFLVNIGDFTGGVVQPPGPICPGDSYQLEAYGGTDYVWTPAQFLDNPLVANPTATINQTTDFMVIISDSCGIDTAYVTLPVFTGTSTISNDTSICIGNSVNLLATGGSTYLWTPSTFLDDPNIPNPISTPTSDITYNVLITSGNGCELTESVSIDVYYTPPVPVIPDTVPLCEGSSVDISVSGADEYLWYPNQFISSNTSPTITVNTPVDQLYYCDFINACGIVTDSVFVDVTLATITAGTDTIICPGESATLWAQGGISYIWSPQNTLNNYQTSQVFATPSNPTMYYVIGTDINGCTNTDSVFVDLFPQPFIQTSPDVHAFVGDQVELYASSSTPGPYIWSPAEFLSCVVCTNPTANPDQNYTYYVSYTDANGCTASDSVNIYYDPILYVPNTFTPGDGDSHNPLFKAEGGNFTNFEMLIFNRWGELIYTAEDINDSWDGTYNGVLVQDGTYVWKATLLDLNGDEHEFVGHVNVLK